MNNRGNRNKGTGAFAGCLSETGSRRGYYLAYTVVFGILSACVFFWFIVSGKSLIWTDDGWPQHYKALVYYAEYLRKILSTLVRSRRLVIPQWDFCISEGADILNTLHYYAIGDPLNLLAVPVPTRFMHLFYSFAYVLRMYLAGCAFSALAFGTGLQNRRGILAGALSYAFCSWTIALRHPFFLNPMIYFPLMILGIEKIIRKERPRLFILSAVLSALSNFYFFYIFALLSVLYAVIRLAFVCRKDLAAAVRTLLQMGLYAVLSVMAAGVILMPVVTVFLLDSRMSVAIPWRWVYPWSYYSALPSMVVSHPFSFWMCIGLSAPAILAVFVLFIKRNNRFLLVLSAICLVMMLFPVFGRILNGMSYMTNRWSWAIALLGAYILAAEWETLLQLTGAERRKAFRAVLLLFLVCLLLEKSRNVETLSAVCLVFAALFILKEESLKTMGTSRVQTLLVLLVCVNAVSLGYWQYQENADSYVTNRFAATRLRNNEANLVRKLSDSEYPRYTGNSLTENANMISQVSSTQYYWSNSNPFMNLFRSDLQLRESLYHRFDGYDDRTALITLSAVDYFVAEGSAGSHLPYGFEKTGADNVLYSAQQKALEELKQELGTGELSPAQEEKIIQAVKLNYSVYENQYALPLGYCYDSWFLKDAWDGMDPVQRQQAQLEAVCLEAGTGELPEYTGSPEDYSVPFTVEYLGDEISETEEGIVTTAENAQLILHFAGKPDAETYIGLEGLDYKLTPAYDLYLGDSSVDPLNLYNRTNWELLSFREKMAIRKEKLYQGITDYIHIYYETGDGTRRTMLYRPEEAAFTSGRHDLVTNLGYREEPVTSVTVTFPTAGVYNLDRIRVYCVPMEEYPGKVGRLQKNCLQDIRMGTDSLTGSIELDRTQLLCVAIPYSSGWRAYIDDAETEVVRANERYMGLLVPEGSHTIILRYTRPYQQAGLLVSAAGLLGLLLLAFLRSRTDKHQDSKRD